MRRPAAGIKPIIGVEAYLAARGMHDRDSQLDKKSSHLLLLAENQTGYQNLLKIASCCATGWVLLLSRASIMISWRRTSEGLICTSGCMSAEVPRMIGRWATWKRRAAALDWYYEVFGPEHFFLELQPHDIPELEEINKHLLTLGRRYRCQLCSHQ